jgi:peptidoglycan/LPS O-acetylase OafA/YrhL
MGTLRFLLALLVLVSHAGVTVRGYNPGVVAVVSFFMLSGYVMTLLIERHYRSVTRVPAFYVDRAARLFPQFLLVVATTVVLVWSGLIRVPEVASCTSTAAIRTALMLPLAFLTLEFSGLAGCWLIPQGWSLGLELTFYLVIPFLVIAMGRSWVAALAMLSTALFVVAYLGLIDTNLWGYRVLPGTLFMFLVGMAFANSKLPTRFAWIVFGGAVALFAVLQIRPDLKALIYNKEVLLGLILGIPAIALIKDLRPSRIDEILGDLSYGIFLNHFVLIWLVQTHIGTVKTRAVFVIALASVLAAAVSYLLVEAPAIRWRRRFRASAPPLRAEPASA